MQIKEAAEALLKIADAIDNDAAEVTQFKCAACNHTATLSSINQRRKTAAAEAGDNITVAEITVEDKLHCPACSGVMAYSETPASKAYYFDPDKVAAEEKAETPAEEAAEGETPAEEKAEETKEASVADYDSLERYLKG